MFAGANLKNSLWYTGLSRILNEQETSHGDDPYEHQFEKWKAQIAEKDDARMPYIRCFLKCYQSGVVQQPEQDKHNLGAKGK